MPKKKDEKVEQLLNKVRARLGSLPPPTERRQIRKQAKLTQKDMANTLGCSRSQFNLWESGEQTPRDSNREKYAQLLRELKQVVDELAATRRKG